jgi:FAD-dependent urate hydroxylase
VRQVGSDPDGADVRFSDGTCGRYDLVVGADGIRSAVRTLALDPAPPRYCGVVGWRSVARGRPAGADHLVLLLGKGRFFGLVPLGDGRTYGFAGVAARSPLDDPPTGRLDRLRALFAGFADPVATYLASLDVDEQVHGTPIERVELDRWHSGRVVLVGDAAHATPPHMGEGGCLAVEDGAVLAEELAAARDVEAALHRYAARRRPRIEWVREQTRLAAAAWVLPAEVRDAALRARGDAALRARCAPLRAAP